MGLVGFDLWVMWRRPLRWDSASPLAAGRRRWDPPDLWHNNAVQVVGALSLRKQAGNCCWLQDLVRRDGEDTWVMSPPPHLSACAAAARRDCGWVVQRQPQPSRFGCSPPSHAAAALSSSCWRAFSLSASSSPAGRGRLKGCTQVAQISSF